MNPVKIALAISVFATIVMLGTAIPVVVREANRLPEVGPFGAPRQEALPHLLPLHGDTGFEIWGTHRYEVEAVVVSRKRYRFDAEAKVSPVDFLLSWGEATLAPNNESITWSQRGRWGYWKKTGPSTVSDRHVERTSANTHIILPHDDGQVRRELMRVRRGDVVRIEGYLVNVDGRDGFTWRSSTSRDDTGDGACEIIYVVDVERTRH